MSRALLLLFCFRRAWITIWWRTFFCAGILIVAGKLWADTTTEEHKARQRAADISNVEALVRLPNFDLGSRPDLQASVDRYLEAHHGTTRYFQLIRQFQLRERSAELLALALSQPKTTPGLWATETLIGFGQRREIEEAVHHKDARRATAAVIALGSVGDPSALDFLARVILKGDLATEVRAAAAAALARSRGGEELLLQAIHEKTLPVDLNFSVGNLLHVSPNPASRALAAARFPLPTVADGNSLPPLQELVAQAGNVRRGSTVFRTKGTCAACHKVAGEGKEVGPDLTEIGSKLSKEAIYVSILDPNAGISHNYENYEIITQSGQIETGLLLDRSGNNIEIKNAEGLVRSFRDSDIESIRKLEVSLMPVGLQQKLTEEELVDLVEYLARLKTKQ